MFGLHHFAASETFVAPGDINLKRAAFKIAVGLAIGWGLPNTQQILTRFKPSLQKIAWDQENVPKQLLWVPNTRWAVTVGVLLFFVLVELQRPSTFLYFQF
jgi:alginate O-acetyltransferase complex protein AlgI